MKKSENTIKTRIVELTTGSVSVIRTKRRGGDNYWGIYVRMPSWSDNECQIVVLGYYNKIFVWFGCDFIGFLCIIVNGKYDNVSS